MTFTEAAVEVLRLVGKPLHYKKITEIAIERNLLSHVGKTPEITMSSRLATMVKKDRGDAPIVKVKPGVFGLRDFDDDVLKAAERESGHDYELPAAEPDETRRPAATPAPEEDGAEAAEAEPPAPRRSEKKLPGQDVFAEEDDDDVPILAKLDEEREESDEDKGRRKRRRRRKRKGGREEGEAESGREERDRGRGERGERDRGRGERGERDRGRGDRDRDRDRSRDRRPSRRERVSGDWDREPAEGEVLGHDLADAVRDVLSNGSPRPLGYRRVAELLVKQGKLSGEPSALVPTVAAAVRGDVARRVVAGTMPRFREVDGEVELLEWSLPREAIRAAEDATRAADRQRDLARRAFLRRVGELPMAGLAELLATWLNAEGVVQLRAVRRPGGSNGAFHLAGVLKRGFEETRLAIVVYRDGSDLGREQVIDVRGAMHHYDNASSAWLLTTGQVLSGARDEAGAPGMAPCGLFDGIELARAMERVNVGLRRHAVPIVSLDLDLLHALGRGQGTPARDVTRERARDEERRDEEAEELEETAEDAADETGEEAGEEVGEEENRGRRRRRRRRRGRGRDRAEGEGATEAGEEAGEETEGEPDQAAAGAYGEEEPDEDESGDITADASSDEYGDEDDEDADEDESGDITADASSDEYDDDEDDEDESDDEEDDEDDDDADEEYEGDLQVSYEDESDEEDEEERPSAGDDEEE